MITISKITALRFPVTFFLAFLAGLMQAQEAKSQVQVSTYAMLIAADGLTIDAAGNLFAANYGIAGPPTVYKIDRNQQVTAFLTNQAGPAGMTFDDHGDLYLSRYDAGEVIRVSPEGTVLGAVASGISGPIGLDFDSDGNLYVNHNVASQVSLVDTAGQQSVYATHSVFNTSSLTLDDDDNLYVSRYQSGRIIKISHDNQDVTDFLTLPIIGIGFVLYSHGYLYATAIRNHFIYRITLAGIADTLAGTGLLGYVDGAGDIAQFNRPNGLTASPDGDTLYVAEHSGTIRMITGVLSSTDIDINDASPISGYSLDQNYPNPFNPTTRIGFHLPSREKVNLTVWDASGKKVRTLLESDMPAGSHEIAFDGDGLSSGFYFYRLQAGAFTEAKRMLLIR